MWSQLRINTCTVEVFSKKFRISGFMSKTSSGIHVSPIFGKVLYACPWQILHMSMIIICKQSKSSSSSLCKMRSKTRIEQHSVTYSIISCNKCSRDSSNGNKYANRKGKSLYFCRSTNPSH